MLCPDTPTLRRKSSNKRIIISSPSREMMHFLTIPNPSANEDPRQRLHIVTPKNKTRSTSSSEERSKDAQGLKRKPSALSRVTFIRKKALNQNWAKNSMEIRSTKLTLNSNYKSRLDIGSSSNVSSPTNSGCRLNFTFGAN
jgi:hypothetical protein